MDMAKVFLEPANSTHRQYEALRAYFVEGVNQAEAARRFGYTPGSFRVLCHELRANPHQAFFVERRKGRRPSPGADRTREQIITLRKRNLSIYDIARALRENGTKLSPPAIATVLREEGFSRLPRRRDEERPAGVRPEVAAVADVRHFDLSPRQFHTDFGGLFLFVPLLAPIPLGKMLSAANFPGSEMIPAEHAVRSLLGLKLFGNARHSHVMSHVLDPGLGLFAGMNVIPKRSFLTEYSCRVDPASYPLLLSGWFDAVRTLGLSFGTSFDLDFHTIPFHGEEALVEKHYVSKRSRRQKGILAFVVNDAENRVFCYVNANLRKETMNDEILAFVRFWKQKTGAVPQELIFDSKLTTYANLSELNRIGVDFITLRRRTANLVDELFQTPRSAWRQIELENVMRAYRTPRILDKKVRLPGYGGAIRQIAVRDLGHEEPTLLLTNQMRRSPAGLIGRYAQRMIIENQIEDSIDFFHIDALSSAVAMKVNCDLILTLMASTLYRLLGSRIGQAYAAAKSAHIFRDLVEASATVTISETDITVRLQKRAHNPLLVAAGFGKTAVPVPWLGGKTLYIQLG